MFNVDQLGIIGRMDGRTSDPAWHSAFSHLLRDVASRLLTLSSNHVTVATHSLHISLRVNQLLTG